MNERQPVYLQYASPGARERDYWDISARDVTLILLSLAACGAVHWMVISYN
jgi:hypothetical protein